MFNRVILMIKYPTGKKVTSAVMHSNSGRGMNLENDINDSNTYYRECNRALIYKKPTPIQVVKVDYPSRMHAKISEAYYKVPSTTDYNGIYRGRYIDFEAKETKAKTSFTFQNIHPHQMDHLEKVMEHGGIAFLIIRFASFNETYLIDAKIVIEALSTLERRSIPYTFIKENGHIIQESYLPRLKYLDVVDKIYFKED